MADKPKNNKNMIIGICAAAVVIVIVVVVAIILATRGGGSQGLSDSYFVSDGTKYVLTLDSEESEDEHPPLKTHLVYTYSGDEITGLKAYAEYADEKTAEAALAYYKDAYHDSYKDISLNGKYIVLTANETEYEGVTASDVKQQIEFMEMLKNMDTDEDVDEGDVVVEEDVDAVEE